MDEGGTYRYLFSLSLWYLFSEGQHKGHILLRRRPGANGKTSATRGVTLGYQSFAISSQAPPFASRRRLRPPRPASNVPSRHAMMLKLPCVRGSGGSSTWASCEAAAQSLERNEQ